MGINIRTWKKPVLRPSRPRRRADETDVQNGLALTPAQLETMTRKGIPIAPQNLGLTYEDAVDVKSFDVPPEHIRGVDIGELWEMRESTNKRFKDKIKNVKPEGAE